MLGRLKWYRQKPKRTWYRDRGKEKGGPDKLSAGSWHGTEMVSCWVLAILQNTSWRQAHYVTTMERQNKWTLLPGLNTDKNRNAVKTTHTSRIFLLPANTSDCCFFTNDSFSLTLLLLPTKYKSVRHTAIESLCFLKALSPKEILLPWMFLQIT